MFEEQGAADKFMRNQSVSQTDVISGTDVGGGF